MEDNGSLTSNILNRNWVLKRKRRKIPFGPDKSNGNKNNCNPSDSDAIASPTLKDGVASLHSSSKKKGNDGYYFECVICDLGGNLLCCDSCPQTYHIECLDPPLKRIPNGKWLCPKCRLNNNPADAADNLDPISKQARTKIVVGKSKSGTKAVRTDKVSRILGSSIPGKKESSGKVKSPLSRAVGDLSSSIKISHPSVDGSAEGSSSFSNVNTEKKLESSPNDALEETKLLSSGKAILSPSRVTELKTDEDTSGNRPDSSCNNGSPGNNVVTKIDASIDKAKKRKRKVPSGDVQKKPRTDKGRFAADTTRKRGSKAHLAFLGTSKPQRKRMAVGYGTSASLPENHLSREIVDVQLKDEMVFEEAGNESGKVEVEALAGEDRTPEEFQQVDRVLGCRVQGSAPISVADTNDTHAEDIAILDIPNLPSEEDLSCNTMSQKLDAENVTAEAKNILCHSDGLKCSEGMRGNKVEVDGGPMTNDCMEVDATPILTSDVKNSDSSDVDDASKDTPALSEHIPTVENVDVNLRHHDNSELTKGCETPVFSDMADKNRVNAEMETISIHKKIDGESALSVSLPSNRESILYEFLVKWVGKSHIHNSWVSESQLKVLAKRKLDNYKAKYGTIVINICEERWKIPQRVIALRSSASGLTEAFVRWTGLSYDECTWEKIDDPVIANSSHLIDLFKQFEKHAFEKDAAKDETQRRKGHMQQTDVVALSDQPKELIGGSLFPHQLEALNWLRKCWHKSKNVILADEMGLGKTVSALAFISSLNFEFKVRLPCLVLVPLSTMPNWMSEFSLWAPNLNVVEYHGAARARALIRQYEWHASSPNGSNKKSDTYKFNVLLTTYEMVLADSSHLRGVPWEVLVVDEGHRLKNSSSKLFSLLNTFSFQHRVLLTGTPLQNNLGEMYNLLNFLQPASFPSLASFEEKFNDLTTAEKVEELKKLVAPHMLRRLKKDAMQNIPPKTERMVPVELSSIQAEYYRAMLTKNYQLLRNIGKGVGQQSMMNIVMQLRKVCNHPYLIQGTEPESGSIEFLHDMRIKASAKLTLLHSMLRILHKEGHRVLIFSQMTKLLDILEDYLNIEFGPKTFERVDGSVSVADRQTAIARFNQDKSRFVFLLSTRSCGLGINLATADTVIIYDSDFNPHADIQAMNRAHRIGQSKRLLVYRLVVRASVEERILQLAKKKLMLDQLFVNKSESQKEVEDILRWGTEELFNDYSPMPGKDSGESNSNKDEVCVNVEQKHKRRTGGLGDVYQDKCTDGNPKIVWDENAIIKLLDRSNLQSGSPDNAEGDLENDMLGSVKSLEWNDEPTEEQGGTDLLPGVTDDASGQNSDKKEYTPGLVTEENEWDRLLRVRWEKHQSEEEAALGRGKRMRKAVSYREAYAPHQVETLSENGADEGPGPEPEPEREYTPAGRALKAKFTMLRARQKERLARRTAAEASAHVDGLSGHESYPFSCSNVQDGNNVHSGSDKPVAEKASVINIADRRGQTLEAPTTNLRSGKNLKLKMNSNLDISMKHFAQHALDSLLPNHHLPGTSYANSLPSSNLLPVLGLCAPNANQMESSQRNIPKSYSRQSRQGIGMDFPFHIAPCTAGTSNEMDVKSRETASDRLKLPDFSLESFHHGQKTSMPDHCLPFNSHTVAAPQGKGAEASESPGAFNDFPKLPFDETMLPKLPFPGRNLSHPQPDLFPSLSLGSRIRESSSSCFQDLPTMPLLPNLKFPEDIPLYNQQEREVHPSLGLGQMPPALSSLPENHRKVLENIMMRTGSGSSNLGKKKLVKDFWSEDELDFLWIGVRRHGRGSWDAMLRDPRLKFSKFRTAEDLAARWDEEQLKISDVPAFPTQKQSKATKSGKSSAFPSISDGMMKRALHGSRFAGPMKFQPHLTDMKLGFTDLPLPHLEASDQLGLHHDHLPPIPAWNTDRFRSNFSSDSSAGPSDRPGTSSNLHLEQPPYMLNSMGTSSLGSLGIDLQLKEDEQHATRSWTLPNFLDQSVNLLRESRNIMTSGESGNSALLASSSKNVSNKLKGRDDLAAESNSSQENKLPHWLRKAVSAPAARPPEPDLPPTVSAIAQSVRVLYGDENPAIPPFVVPGLPPSRPKDPRRSLKKKKKKKHRSSYVLNPPDLSGSNLYYQSTLHGDYTASTSVKPAVPFPLLPQMPGSSEGYPRLEPDLILPSLNLNMMNPSSSSSVPSKPKKKASGAGSGLSPSPEVLQLVAACIAPPPSPPPPVPVPGSTSSSLLESDPIPIDPSEQGRVVLDAEDTCGKQKAPIVPVDEVKAVETASGDSSKTQSDPTRPQPDVEEEVSSEGTVSDHHVSDHES